MNIEYIKDNFEFQILTEEHDLSNFECDSNDLTDFLKNDALNQQKMNLNITQLAVCDGEIVGFVSLLTDTIKLRSIEDLKLKEEIKEELNISENNDIPAIKIGRFAIDKKYAGKGLGSHIFRNVLLSILYLSKYKVGLRFITVEAYAVSFNFWVSAKIKFWQICLIFFKILLHRVLIGFLWMCFRRNLLNLPLYF